MSEEHRESEIRNKFNIYTTAVILTLSTGIFLSVVPFLPGAPILPALLGIGLGISALKRPVWAAGVLALLVFLSIFYQLIYFGLASMFSSALATGNYFGVGVVVLLLLFFIVDLIGARAQPTSFALALLAVSLMLTPYFWLSLAAIVIAAAMGGAQNIKRSIGTVASAFVATITPLLMMANALDFQIFKADPVLAQVNWGGVGTHTSPIIFSHLANLANAFATPLPCLNIGAGCIGSGASPYAANSLSGFVANSAASSLLIIPLIMLAVIFSSSTSIAGIIQSVLTKFSWHEKIGALLRVTVPLVAALGTTLAFIGLISLLAPIGPFQTDLVSNGGINLSVADNVAAGALLVGAAFSAREFGIQKLERLEFARLDLAEIMAGTLKTMADIGEVVSSTEKKAPTVSIAGERKQLQEHRAYIDDISAGYNHASLSSILHWIKDLRERVNPSLSAMPESIRIKVIDELNKLMAQSATYNNILDEAGVKLRFPDYEVKGDMSHKEALGRYGVVTSGLKDATLKLHEDYSATTAAFNRLMGKELVVPPIDPRALLETNDYPAAMRLESEDYWVSFNLSQDMDLRKKCNQLLSLLQPLGAVADQQVKALLLHAVEIMRGAKPIDSKELLTSAQNVVSAYQQGLKRMGEEFSQMQKLVRTLPPETTRIVRFETLGLVSDQEKLAKGAASLQPSLDDLADFTEQYGDLTGKVAAARKEDTRNIMVLAQYQLAKKYIESLAEGKKTIPVSDLPFQRDAAVMYVKLVAEETRAIKYDDMNEEILIIHAKV